MKVLMIGNHSRVKGGITSVISQLLEHNWKEENIEMMFIPTYIETGILAKTVYFFIAYIRILLVMLWNKPNILHIHMSYKGSFVRKYMIHKMCKRFGIKDIIHLHGSEFKQWFDSRDVRMQKKIRKMFRESLAVIVLGEEWNKRIKEIEPLAHTIVVNNTVEIPKQMTTWNLKTFQVLFLGVLIKRKGVSDLIYAISELNHERVLDEKTIFVIAGTGDEEDTIKKLCKELEIEQFVKFNGWTDGMQKKKLLQESQLLVLPSYNEGLPMAVLEAMSYGIPIVATKVGDVPEAVEDGANGFLYHAGNINELKNCLKVMLQLTENEWQMYSAKSRDKAQRQFNDAKYYRKIAKVYNR